MLTVPVRLGTLGDIRRLLNADVRAARVLLAKHVAGRRMLPQAEAKKEGEWNLLGGYAEGTHDGAEKRVRIGCGGRI